MGFCNSSLGKLEQALHWYTSFHSTSANGLFGAAGESGIQKFVPSTTMIMLMREQYYLIIEISWAYKEAGVFEFWHFISEAEWVERGWQVMGKMENNLFGIFLFHKGRRIQSFWPKFLTTSQRGIGECSHITFSVEQAHLRLYLCSLELPMWWYHNCSSDQEHAKLLYSKSDPWFT